MNMRDEDYKYDIGLVLLGIIIGYISTLTGGVALLVSFGGAIALLIGYKSQSATRAALLGAFFGIVVVTASSPLVQGLGSFKVDIMQVVMIPYIRDVLVAALMAGVVSAVSYSLFAKK